MTATAVPTTAVPTTAVPTTASQTAASPTGAASRSLPRLGGYSTTVVRLEVRRLLRNKRVVVFTFLTPAMLFLLFGTDPKYRTERVGDGNVTGYVLLSMAVYGAMLATTSGGAMVSVERALGWSRQLRLTPVRPAAYIAVKVTVAMVIAAASVATALLVGRLDGASLPGSVWLQSGLLAWLCAVVFAAFGLFMGYLLPTENVMQILGPVLGLLSFAGGLFVPVEQFGHTFATIARLTPVYGVGAVARYPLTHDGSLLGAGVNIVVWTVLFSAGAVWRFRRDTARV